MRHVGEAVAAGGGRDARGAGRRPWRPSTVEYEPLTALLDMEEALTAGEVMAHWKIRRGERRGRLSRADLVVVEGTYRTPYQEHAYIETNGMIAVPDGTGRCRGLRLHAVPVLRAEGRGLRPGLRPQPARASCRR